MEFQPEKSFNTPQFERSPEPHHIDPSYEEESRANTPTAPEELTAEQVEARKDDIVRSLISTELAYDQRTSKHLAPEKQADLLKAIEENFTSLEALQTLHDYAVARNEHILKAEEQKQTTDSAIRNRLSEANRNLDYKRREKHDIAAETLALSRPDLYPNEDRTSARNYIARLLGDRVNKESTPAAVAKYMGEW